MTNCCLKVPSTPDTDYLPELLQEAHLNNEQSEEMHILNRFMPSIGTTDVSLQRKKTLNPNTTLIEFPHATKL